jgi:Tol biopolymer transport system component
MFESGTRLGPYEIVGLLDAGGMGEVYRARDTQLKREVAMKLLPPAFAADADRLARFDREAQVLAALNHPNIATIYGIETSSGRNALVLELIEGETLADVLAQAQLPVAEAVRVATQLAGALEAAHERGIIHRDLKPANIKLTRNGVVKVLDFGLAKLTTPTASPESSLTPLSLSPTMTSPAMLTGHGIILGTAAYMSPEQARGKDVDRRTDIWAFGCVLFEMLTGRHAFGGDSITDVLARIIERDVNWALLPATTPVALRRLLRRCLMKAPSDRLRDAGDIVIELTEAAEELAAPPASHHVALAGGRFAAISLRGVAVIVVSLAVGVAGTYVLAMRGRGDARQPFSMENAEFVQLTTTGRAERPALSPDGKYVVYVERDGTDFSLRLRQTSTTSTTQIVAPDPGVRIFGATVSPEGAFVDYVRDGATPRALELWRVPLLGGSARRLTMQVHSTITWSPDGSKFAFVRFDGPAREGELFGLRHSVMVGDRRDFSSRVIWTSGKDIGLVSFATTSALVRPPVWSPDGRRLAIAAADREGDRVLVLDTEGGGERRLAIPGRGLFGQAWLSDSELVLNVLTSQGSPTQLWHYSLADSRARRLTHDVNGFLGIDVSADRSTWVTSRSDIRVSLWIGDGEGTNGKELAGPMLYNYIVLERARVSWSGNQVFFAAASTRPESETGPGWRIAVFRVTPPDATALEVLDGVTDFVGMPSGNALIYLKACSGPCLPADNGLWRSDADGGSARMLLPGDVEAPVPTPDGKQLIHGKDENGVVTPWIVEMSGGTPRQISTRPGTPLRVSRDGRRLLLNSPDGPQVCDLPACAERIPVQVAGPNRRLLPDGKGVAYVDTATRSNIWVQPIDGGKPYQLTRFTDGRQIGDFAWSHDGTRLAMTLLSMPTDVVLLKGLRAAP